MFYGVNLSSRLLLGTARYPSPAVLVEFEHALAMHTIGMNSNAAVGRLDSPFFQAKKCSLGA